MPSRNITKERAPESYYHVYARGGNKQIIFLENIDYRYFINLFERYLSEKPSTSKDYEVYPNFFGRVKVLAYCLKKNHFHILIYQSDVPDLEKFMRSVMTSYSRYFNLKYKRTGPVFESRYKAVRIDSNSYLQHVSRYIHLNPIEWEGYDYSSMKYYKSGNEPCWLNTTTILEQFNSRQEYTDFVSDYKEMHDMLGEIQHQLADQ